MKGECPGRVVPALCPTHTFHGLPFVGFTLSHPGCVASLVRRKFLPRFPGSACLTGCALTSVGCCVQPALPCGLAEQGSVYACAPIPPLLFLHAGPGAGKSTAANELADRLSRHFGSACIRFLAPSGIAASNLRRGSTCHHGLGLRVADGDGAHALSDSTAATMHHLRRRWQGCRVVVIDEVSMVGCSMLREIHSRLCDIMLNRLQPFGGLCVVLMGDFIRGQPFSSRQVSLA